VTGRCARGGVYATRESLVSSGTPSWSKFAQPDTYPRVFRLVASRLPAVPARDHVSDPRGAGDDHSFGWLP
jgi:hypothetical protein